MARTCQHIESSQSGDRLRSCILPALHGGIHVYPSFNPVPMVGRSATRLADLRSVLIQTAVDGKTPLDRKPYADFSISQIGAFCEEDVEARDLWVTVNGLNHSATPFDSRYLSRLWPSLFTLPSCIHVGRGDFVEFSFPGRAVVVIAGASIHELER